MGPIATWHSATIIEFGVSMQLTDLEEGRAAMVAQGLTPAADETAVYMSDGHRKHPTFEAAVNAADRTASIKMPEAGRAYFAVYLPTLLAEAGVQERYVDIPTLVRQLAEVPFLVASFSPIHRKAWRVHSRDDGYHAPGLGHGHGILGFAAAFRGAGHDRLVSANWLHGGAFHVWRHADVSLIQFHALDADPATALAQAIPGHRQIGICADTGFIQRPFNFLDDYPHLYDAATQTLRVVVLGRDIPNRELLQWAAARKQPPTPTTPVRDVAFIFPDEAEAHAHLLRLWRYGHQVWTIRNGAEVRLDPTVIPPTSIPPWAG